MALLRGILLIIATSETFAYEDNFDLQDTLDIDSNYGVNNCTTTTDSYVIFQSPNGRPSEQQSEEMNALAGVLVDGVNSNNNTNMSHLRIFTVPRDWDERKPKLEFPKTSADERYKMATLHLDKGFFVFDFLRSFLSFIQPYNVPTDLLIDAIESRIATSKLISESVHVEAAFLGVVGLCCILCCVVPGTEVWLACRPIREDYKPSRHPGALAFLLTIFVLIFGSCMVTMIICNETVSANVEKIPLVVETALQDLTDYHSGTTLQLRKCLTRSLDVATEAILADLDNVEDLLGKPVQAELASETGLDVALDALLDLANAPNCDSPRSPYSPWIH